MKRLGELFRTALFTPIHAGAPAGHNNRVLRARVTLVAAVGGIAGAVAVAGTWAIRYPEIAIGTALLAVGFAAGVMAGKLAERLGLITPAHATDSLAPFTKPDRPS